LSHTIRTFYSTCHIRSAVHSESCPRTYFIALKARTRPVTIRQIPIIILTGIKPHPFKMLNSQKRLQILQRQNILPEIEKLLQGVIVSIAGYSCLLTDRFCYFIILIASQPLIGLSWSWPRVVDTKERYLAFTRSPLSAVSGREE